MGQQPDFCRELSRSTVNETDKPSLIGARRAAAKAYSGNQPGDPVRGAAAMIRAIESESPPLRLLLGSDAYGLAFQRLDALKANFEAWKDLTVSADFIPA